MAELPPAPGTTDVVCGDFNEDAVTGTAGGVVRRAGFVDVLVRSAGSSFTPSAEPGPER